MLARKTRRRLIRFTLKSSLSLLLFYWLLLSYRFFSFHLFSSSSLSPDDDSSDLPLPQSSHIKGWFFVSDDASSFWRRALALNLAEASSVYDPKVEWFAVRGFLVRVVDAQQRFVMNPADWMMVRDMEDDVLLKYAEGLGDAGLRNCPRVEDFVLERMDVGKLVRFSQGEDGGELLILRSHEHFSVVASMRDVVEVAKRHPVEGKIVARRLVDHPALFEKRRFAIRTWVVPLRGKSSPLLAYFGVGPVSLAVKTFDEQSIDPQVHVTSLPVEPTSCIKDLISAGVLPEWNVLIPHLKRLSLFVFAAMNDDDEQRPETGPIVIPEPLCLDFEMDDVSRLWLVDWKSGSQCVPKPEKVEKARLCAKEFNFADVGGLVMASALDFMDGTQDFPASFGSLEMLVDEKRFSRASEDLCQAASSSGAFEKMMHRREATKKRVEKIFQIDGMPKTVYQSWFDDDQQENSHAIKCEKCSYVNVRDASRCELCGHVLQSGEQHRGKINARVDAGGGAQGGVNYKARLTALFLKYDPSRVPNVNSLLERYRGDEEDLIARTARQYDALARVSRTRFRDRVVELFEKYDPDRLASVDTLLEKYRAREEQLVETLELKYI